MEKAQIKKLVARGRMQRSRVHIGRDGLTKGALDAFVRSFDGVCIRPYPCDVVKVKLHATFCGDVDKLIDDMCIAAGAVFLKREDPFLFFWKPDSVG